MTIHRSLRDPIHWLKERPAFVVIAVATVALGIGANTAIFSIVSGVLLRPLPYPEDQGLTLVWQTNPAWADSPNPVLQGFWDRFPVSYPVYRDWLELNQVFEHLGVYDDHTFAVTGGGSPTRLPGTRMTWGAFAALGVGPRLGRLFTAEEDRIGGPRLTVLSDGLWRRRFAAEPDVLGQTLSLDREPFTIVGVMPPGFAFPGDSELWTTFDDRTRSLGRDTQGLQAIARLAAGASLSGAQRQMEAVTATIVSRHPDDALGIRLEPLRERVIGEARPALLLLFGTVAAVLLIACANLANLLLVRAMQRRRELAVRAALGAGRGRLIGELLRESLTLAIVGGAAGVALAAAALPLLTRWLHRIPRIETVAIDQRVLLYSTALTLLTGLAVGILPALGAVRSGAGAALRSGARGLAGGRSVRRLQALLVVSEVGLAFTLLFGATLLGASFSRLAAIEPGFAAQGLVTAWLEAPEDRYPAERLRSFYPQLLDALAALPGIEAVTAGDRLPFSGGTSSGTTTLERIDGPEETNLERSVVTPGYFDVLGIPIIAGRGFTPADREGGAAVTVISRAMAERFWPGGSPLGSRLKTGSANSDNPWLEIVGVAGDVHHSRLDRGPTPKHYLPYGQRPARGMTVVLRTATAAAILDPELRRAVWALDPDLPVEHVGALSERLAGSIAASRVRASLITALGAVAALLAVVGIYGVIANAVSQRRQEIGIRMALGARRGHVVRGVLTRALLLTGLGLGTGLVLIAWLARLIESFLFEVSPTDPLLLTAVAALLGLTALLAGLVPASRAAAVDPIAALRD